MFETECQIFFGRADGGEDPKFAGAIFHRAVMGLILEIKAAVFHGKSSRKSLGLCLRG
jgi:hypothetical protein